MSHEDNKSESILAKESFDSWVSQTFSDDLDRLEINSILNYFNLRYSADQIELRLNQLFDEPDSSSKEKEVRDLTSLIKQTGANIENLQNELESQENTKTALTQCEVEYSKIKIQ